MGRLVLGLLAAALLLTSSDVRAWLAPRAQPALDPVYEWSARSRVRQIARLVETRSATGHPPPTTRDFPELLARHFGREGGALDPWGTAYYLERGRREVVVGSAGRDREPGTGDDVRETVTAAPR